jgi:vancomycin permeability regulator SanA
LKKRSQNNGPLFFISLLTLFYLCGLSFAKYYFNEISIREYKFDYIGNILNLVIAFGVVVGCVVLSFSKRKIDNRKYNLLFALQIISILLIVFIYLVTKVDIISSNGYLFHFPIKKVFNGLFYILSALLQIYSMIYIWGLIIGHENLFELRTLIRTLGAVLILLIFSLLYVWNVRVYDESKIQDSTFDYGFVPGAAVYSRGKPSPIFEARIKKAYELYHKGIIKKIFLTGGNAPGEISESEAAAKYLTSLGVSSKDVIIEHQSTTTTEQLKYLRVKVIVIKEHIPIIIVSDGFHLTRITQISKLFNVKTIGVSSNYSMSLEKALFYRARESVALLMFWFFAI